MKTFEPLQIVETQNKKNHNEKIEKKRKEKKQNSR